MNEAAVELLGSYYKSKNLRKWDKVFHDTRCFVLQIGNIDPDWMRTGHQDRKIKFKDLEAAKLFPWKDDVVDDLAGDVLQNKAMKSSYLEKFVELIGFKDPSIKLELDQRLQLSNSKRFYIPKQFTQTWNKIIRITLVKMKEFLWKVWGVIKQRMHFFKSKQNDIQVMKLAVYTIGCYYKNQDPIKWEQHLLQLQTSQLQKRLFN
ncbi:uncharacterized protein PGTG_10148 [Puccinia graminis f. sp. tritici CRL 75-36-700-3]|uniref:Uncharacterized protein n=1 Tax=Puccinia graminis f. sp. tritici (strain CRL 75-36-700-3 / race SCCL) TaxID=418459 RepID=E3KJF3_PUCGT|nr:uncharacterized protein PGTG_10148 [Puccinia graminis f. sp. tritici CRL 75-36-700-3]EFP84428.1 hypothetical protein PGTG_10148 [Puccinia graminis f. sp. tritici CRL 75-36-700-3]